MELYTFGTIQGLNISCVVVVVIVVVVGLLLLLLVCFHCYRVVVVGFSPFENKAGWMDG